MAVFFRISVGPSSQDQFNQLDARVGQAMMAAGGPPDGLMSHVVYPEGEGFVIAQVWRNETAARAHVDEVLVGQLTEEGLTLQSTQTQPVWSFAKP